VDEKRCQTDSLEEDEIRYEPDESFVAESNVAAFMDEHDIEDVEELYERTVSQVDGEPASGLEWFWDEVVDHLDLEFYETYDQVRDSETRHVSTANGETVSYDGPQFTDWYVGGELNIAHNVVVDRHAQPDAETRNKVATIWEGEDGEVREVTYHELHRQSNQVANALAERGIDTGDTVGLYMPMVPEIVPLLYGGCFKVGAIAVPIFSGFGVDATATRIEDAECSVLFTGDGFYRRGSAIKLKSQADEAIAEAGHVEHTIVYDRLGSTESSSIPWAEDRDEWWSDAVDTQPTDYETKALPADQESMLLYSSGTTGAPKGIVHTHAGGLVQPAKEIYFSFDHKPSDRFFWVSDIGWMMGPWTLIGNHAHGGTSSTSTRARRTTRARPVLANDRRPLADGVRYLPDGDPRAPEGGGREAGWGHDLSSLRLLGSTGEPWDPSSWNWFRDETVGGGRPDHEHLGGTEIFGCFLQPTPLHSLKPGTLGGPALGMDIDIVDASGASIADTNEAGVSRL